MFKRLTLNRTKLRDTDNTVISKTSPSQSAITPYKSILLFVIFLLLVAGESWFIQVLSRNSEFEFSFAASLDNMKIRRLLLLDIIATLFILFLPRTLCYLILLLHFLLSTFIFSYIVTLGSLPTFTAIYNGISLLSDAAGADTTYISIPFTLSSFALLSLSCIARAKIVLPTARIRFALTCIFFIGWGVFLTLQIAGFNILNDHVYYEKDLQQPASRAIKRYGYLATWALEFFGERYVPQKGGLIEQNCSEKSILDFPVFPLGTNITLIQVESLDYLAITAMNKGKLVAPHLKAISDKGFFLEMDGVKHLGSANSDYELLNSKVCTQDILYYNFINSFPDSIAIIFRDAGFETSIFHGVRGSYMNLRTVYPQMGFNSLFFKEELLETGYQESSLLMHSILDRDLFNFAEKKASAARYPYFHFIITMTMHDGYNEPGDAFPNHPYFGALSHFDSALGKYIDGLPEGAVVIVYGDHQSYFGEHRTNTVPFILFTKGHSVSTPAIMKTTILSRCEISNWLRRLAHASVMENLSK